MIVQNASSTGTTDLSFTLHQDDFALAEKSLTAARPANRRGRHDSHDRRGQAQRRRHRHALACREWPRKLFACLGEAGVNIQLISTSEIKIAVVIDEGELDRAAQAVHIAFGLARPRPPAS